MISPSFLPYSHRKDSRESGPRDYSPLPIWLFLSLPPTSLTFSQMDYEQNGASSATVKATSSTSKRCSQTQTKFKFIPKRRSVWGPAYVSSEQHLKPTRTEDALVAGGLPEETNGLEKTTKTEAHSSLTTVHACPVSSQSIPGKIWILTNQISATSARAHAPREFRARALQSSRSI